MIVIRLKCSSKKIMIFVIPSTTWTYEKLSRVLLRMSYSMSSSDVFMGSGKVGEYIIDRQILLACVVTVPRIKCTCDLVVGRWEWHRDYLGLGFLSKICVMIYWLICKDCWMTRHIILAVYREKNWEESSRMPKGWVA